MLEKEATHMPLWFHKEYDPLTNTMMHVRVLGGELKGRLGGRSFQTYSRALYFLTLGKSPQLQNGKFCRQFMI